MTQNFNVLSVSVDKNPLLTKIPGRVFEKLGKHVYGHIYLNVQSNRLTSIEESAFAGIENKMTVLNLDNNSLTHIPVAIGTLRNLHDLQLTQNPIKSLDANVLSNIGPSLDYFSLSMGHFSTFPTEMKLLTNLTELRMKEVRFSVIDRHALSGQAPTLAQLEIWDSILKELPKALCDLSNLKTIIIQHNNMSTLGNFSTECSLTQVTRIHLWNNTITAIYDKDFSGFTNVEYLDLNQNPIRFISKEAFKHNINLTHIDLSITHLHLLPTTLTTLPKLNTVILSGLYNCSCATMYGFKNWGQTFLVNKSPYLMYGAACYDSYIGVEEYILKQLPNCVDASSSS